MLRNFLIMSKNNVENQTHFIKFSEDKTSAFECGNTAAYWSLASNCFFVAVFSHSEIWKKWSDPIWQVREANLHWKGHLAGGRAPNTSNNIFVYGCLPNTKAGYRYRERAEQSPIELRKWQDLIADSTLHVHRTHPLPHPIYEMKGEYGDREVSVYNVSMITRRQ